MTQFDMSKLTHKTLEVSRGLTYSYYTSPPASPSKPTLLLFHGWPDSAALWSQLLNDHLLPKGYGIIAPDCLGYGGTSKPTDPKLYAFNLLAADAAEILAKENVGKVISFGHDWGSTMAQRFYNFFPNLCVGLGMVNVAYMPPSGDFDLDTVNAVTKSIFGHGIFEYWHFFTAEDSTALMRKNIDSVYAITFGEPSSWLDTWCTPGGMREWVTEGKTQPTLPYADEAHHKDFMDRLNTPEGFDAPSCWYKAFNSGVQNESDKKAPEEGKVVTVPTFYWGGDADAVCRPAGLQPSVAAGLLPQLKTVVREGGHWALLEQPEVFGKDVVEWLEETSFDV